MRGNITGLFQVCVVIGVALSYWVNYFTSISSSLKGTTAVWQIPVAMQLAPLAVMFAILPFIKESPRWLASKNRNAEALKNLAWVRNMSPDDSRVQAEFSEIVAAVEEEKAATAGASWVSEIRAKGNPKRFIIAMLMFVCQQWSGQNSINYYAPDIFKSIGITGSSASLLASGVYGLVKIVATALFMIFGVERAGRKKYFFFGALGMGLCLMMIGAIFKSHPPKVPKEGETLPVPPSGIGMAGRSLPFARLNIADPSQSSSTSSSFRTASHGAVSFGSTFPSCSTPEPERTVSLSPTHLSGSTTLPLLERLLSWSWPCPTVVSSSSSLP